MDDYFWPLEIYSEKLKRNRLQTFTYIYYYFRALFIALICSIIVLVLFPLTSPIRTTPLSCYELFNYEDNFGYYLIVYAMQFFNMLFAATSVTAYDGFFLDLVTRLVFELKILREKIENLDLENVKSKKDEKEKYEDIKKYVQHHALLLRYYFDN